MFYLYGWAIFMIVLVVVYFTRPSLELTSIVLKILALSSILLSIYCLGVGMFADKLYPALILPGTLMAAPAIMFSVELLGAQRSEKDFADGAALLSCNLFVLVVGVIGLITAIIKQVI